MNPFFELDSSVFFPFSIDGADIPPMPQLVPPEEPAGPAKRGRKRALRKDRHSKIQTAQGMRDRRMRLSLDVAQEFFNIQDMLGFDKASKTLRWLITAAKPAIEELFVAVSGPKSASSKSVDSSTSGLESAGDKIKFVKSVETRMKKRTCRRPPAAIARESRIRARARARERTQRKKLMFSSAGPLEAVKEDSSSHDVRSSVLDHPEEHCSRSPDWRQLLPVTIFDYSPISPNITVSLFHEQWVDMETMLQADVQRYAWEA